MRRVIIIDYKDFKLNFASTQFYIFFVVVAVLVWAVAHPLTRTLTRTLARALVWIKAMRRVLTAQIILLAASLFFYACWNPKYILLLLLSVFVTWQAALRMEDRSVFVKRLILAASLVINLGVLFLFKYGNFALENIQILTGNLFAAPHLSLLLPIGISFYTFQALGYAIDVYRGKIKAERSIITYALFVTFFPQLVAGPIERAANLLPQFKKIHPFVYNNVANGLKLAAFGVFKKVLVADSVAPYVDAVFAQPATYPSTALALAAFFFAIQIYCDFSGYSDIAIGCARMLGFNLMTNFRAPYLANSISDFWRRWHISLSSWLKDYIYIPLGGSRKGAARHCVNLIVTFLISGLWHGAAWHFVQWGAVHGVLINIERLAKKLTTPATNVFRGFNKAQALPYLFKPVRCLITFIIVCIAWIFFRANSTNDVFVILAKLTKLPADIAGIIAGLPHKGIIDSIYSAFWLGGAGGVFVTEVTHPIGTFNLPNFGFSFIFIALLFFIDYKSRRDGYISMLERLPRSMRWGWYYIFSLIMILNYTTNSTPFIYFEF